MATSIVLMVTGGVTMVIGVLVYSNIQEAVNTTLISSSANTMLDLVPTVIVGVGLLQMFIGALLATR